MDKAVYVNKYWKWWVKILGLSNSLALLNIHRICGYACPVCMWAIASQSSCHFWVATLFPLFPVGRHFVSNSTKCRQSAHAVPNTVCFRIRGIQQTQNLYCVRHLSSLWRNLMHVSLKYYLPMKSKWGKWRVEMTGHSTVHSEPTEPR
jgi:hypothetical protein